MNPRWRIPEWFPSLSVEVLELLRMFHVELQKFNRAVNLVSPATIQDADLTHFSDSVLAFDRIQSSLLSPIIADFGSGGGFPSIVFAILDTHAGQRHWIANDIDQRKIEFLKHCQRKLNLKNFSAKVSDLSRPVEAPFFQVTCRAFAPMREIIRKYAHNVAESGEIFALKGRNWEEELGLVEKSLGSTWNISKHSEYSLPIGVEHRFVIRIARN